MAAMRPVLDGSISGNFDFARDRRPFAMGLALIVGADPDQANVLGRLLRREGYRTLAVADGEAAVGHCRNTRPAIIFIELGLTGLKGFEAVRVLKRDCGDEETPVVFMTQRLDEDMLLKCVEAGGDDFLAEPIEPSRLKSRLLVLERLRGLRSAMVDRKRALSELLDWEREEEALAERVLGRAVKNRNVLMDRIGLVQRPAAVFSGDLVLTQHLPDGGLRVLLADFTGHGLAAAVGALPIADAFHAMTLKGVGDDILLEEINRKLYQLLPADRFMAACLVTIPVHGEELLWWNGGMPSGWLRTAQGLRELTAHALPLGILPELPVLEAPIRIRVQAGDRLLLMTDGLLEAEDSQGRMFWNYGFETLLGDWEYGGSLLSRLFEQLDVHCADTEQADDIAVLEIPFGPDLIAASGLASGMAAKGGWTAPHACDETPVSAGFSSPLVSPSQAEPSARGTALIVDDSAINRQLLSYMLRQEGFVTLTANDGEEAIACLESTRPDMIFMDVVMPRMNGIEATRAIKTRLGEDFVPVIFLSALRSEETMMECIRAGGDDFLTKPFNVALLKARIRSMERARDLRRRDAAANLVLIELLERRQQEQLLAERVFSRAIKNRNVAIERLGLIQRPTATFNGDLVLTQYLPDGGLRVLMADITGHGLGATIGALPVAEAFHAMTLKGVADNAVLAEINRKLHLLLPTERFMSACLVTISRDGRVLRWWNGGMPSVWVRTRRGLIELVSHALPLGVLPTLPVEDKSRRLDIELGDALLLFTDGLAAASDRRGIRFGEARLKTLLNRWSRDRPLLPDLESALNAHCGDVEQPDDIAALEIHIEATLFTGAPARD
ncbi:SpoIIE family protein phosphatase [Thiocystis violacea]|uniref:SpoIIE family protein phosphatase n=1 Tax=Thiocystis violacea TaxID=13725 RepID=UPI001904537A|nr:SpoIIE family protein phosphatase [Thiocystis violacea]MBK1717863.1 hypothetical protein [Thiocystis violacea]